MRTCSSSTRGQGSHIIEDVGFLGIEGASQSGSRNHLSFALHTEEEVREHLRRSWKDLGASPECLVIVSHTSLAGCRLDIGLRFGFERLGSAVRSRDRPECDAGTASHGITRLEEILAGPAGLAAIQFGPVRTRLLHAYLRAQAENTAVWVARPQLPDQVLFYDVETGLTSGGPFGPLQEPWMIAVSDGIEVKQWAVPEEDWKRRRALYREFVA